MDKKYNEKIKKEFEDDFDGFEVEGVVENGTSDDFDDLIFGDDEELTVKFDPSVTMLEEGVYEKARIDRIETSKKKGQYGMWTRLSIQLLIACNKTQGHGYEKVYYVCSSSLKANGRLFNIVKAVLGSVPREAFKLKETLIGKDVKVKIKRVSDEYGNIYAEVEKLIF